MLARRRGGRDPRSDVLPRPAAPTGPAVGGWRRWASGRAVLVHAVCLFVSGACLVAAWWQVDRARAGNPLSFVYAVEWPVFAGITAWGWWQLIHVAPDRASRPAPAPPRWISWDREGESPELRSYNRYLVELHRSGRDRTGRELRRARRRALAAAPDVDRAVGPGGG